MWLALIAAGLWWAPCPDSRAQDNAGPTSAASGQSRRGAAAMPRFEESDLTALPAMRIEGSEAASAGQGEPSRPAAVDQNGGFSYTVRPGDSLSAIAQLYGLDLSELARANRFGEELVLHVGQTLKIPNPFAAQVRHLEATVQKLSVEAEAARHKDEAEQARIRALSDQIGQLSAAKQELEHGARTLPWWRGLALTAGAAALLMLGVTVLTVLEWLMLRRRFYALAEMNEAIRRLDQKYRVALAKAELRLQQLYGRRRVAAEDQDKSMLSPEEVEIDRLNQQLKELMQQHLERLGLTAEKAGRRNRIRDLLGGAESLAEVRAGRR